MRLPCWLSISIGFKEINDTHGHAAGDACLRRIARRLKATLPLGVLAARTGGDEFAVIWKGTEGQTPDDLIEKVFEVLNLPIVWRGHEFHLSCSIGVATRRDGCSFVPDDLLHEADLALYEAKREGKNCWRLFRQELETATIKRKSVLTSAKDGLIRDRFRLFYQPKVLLANGTHSRLRGVIASHRRRRLDPHPELILGGVGRCVDFQNVGRLRRRGRSSASACVDLRRRQVWPYRHQFER